MIQIEQDENARPVPYAVIYKAVSKAELSMRMQRDFLIKQYRAEIMAMKHKMRRKIYITRTHVVWRIGHFLNGERHLRIRDVKLTGAEVLAAENQALASCVDMTAINANSDMAYKLRTTMNMHMNRQSLNLPARYLQFVMTFNPEAFDAKESEAPADDQEEDGENQPIGAPTNTDDAPAG